MSTGKYSPTVVASYHEDQTWWDRHCLNEGDLYDRDGYDEYGYNEAGLDRAGYREEDYLADEDGEHILFENMLAEWTDAIA